MRLQADIDDSLLKAPRNGRVRYRVAEPGEVLAAGGKLLNMVDLADVYMTFFLPSAQAGKVELGQDVRLVIDAVSRYVIPAKVSYVASVAQFTPKTVETANEREKLMFRVKARLDPDLLAKYATYVKTGVPGMATCVLTRRSSGLPLCRSRFRNERHTDGRQPGRRVAVLWPDPRGGRR